MKLVVLSSDYGHDRYFTYYLMDHGKCLDAKWSKKFSTNDLIICNRFLPNILTPISIIDDEDFLRLGMRIC